MEVSIKMFKEKYGAKLEFKEGWVNGGSNQKTSVKGVGGRDIFWNNTIPKRFNTA